MYRIVENTIVILSHLLLLVYLPGLIYVLTIGTKKERDKYRFDYGMVGYLKAAIFNLKLNVCNFNWDVRIVAYMMLSDLLCKGTIKVLHLNTELVNFYKNSFLSMQIFK